MSTTTKRLLLCGVVGGPLFVAVGLAQALTRTGFDLTHQSLSMLTLGSAGWIQITNFLLAGVLASGYAIGLRRRTRGERRGKRSALMLNIYGAGLILGGIFHPDAGGGFPPGTPEHESVVRTWHGALHMVAGTSAFIALIVACFLLGRYYRDAGLAMYANASRAVGTIFAVCVLASGAPGGSLILFIGAGVAMLWTAIVACQLLAGAPQHAYGTVLTAADARPLEQLG